MTWRYDRTEEPGCADLKTIYGPKTLEAAELTLQAFEKNVLDISTFFLTWPSVA